MENAGSSLVRPFQVDLGGVVDLLSRHIYSGADVYLRELLQNGRDAIAARAKADGGQGRGGIEIFPVGTVPESPEEFVFRDAGQGLSAAEAGELLATVGKSSKRDDVLNLRDEDYLGQFGIGLLSCFMVSDRIVVRSRSVHGHPPVEWTGSADGTFSIRELTEAESGGVAIGTEVRLSPRPDDAALLSAAKVLSLARRFGRYLPVEVLVRRADQTWETVNEPAVFLPQERPADERSAAEALEAFGAELTGNRPLETIEISVPATGTQGVAYVLPFAPPPGARRSGQLYLGRMLLGEDLSELLPEWAYFVRCVLNTEGLRPTASREQLVADEALEYTREEIGKALRRWIVQQATTRPARFERFVAVHHLGLKSMAVHDDDLAAAVLPWLTVETSAGRMTVRDYLDQSRHVRYVETVDEFRQIAAVVPPDQPVINGGYTYESDLLRRLPLLIDDVTVEQVQASSILDELAPPPMDDRSSTSALERRAAAVLADLGCDALVRSFRPDNVTALYVADAAAIRRIERTEVRDSAPAVWADVLGGVDAITAGKPGRTPRSTTAQLCLNWQNPMIRQLSNLDDQLVFDRSVRLIYIQALLAGHRPLSRNDRTVMTTAMSDLIQLSVGVTS
ncbi:molecular chaperone HtpG [Saccharopolyspora kobensis]|uniref:Molecular chaperone HtpG n=1 Tax=Saccharopolyspora kobensis TaxID=146035 RepID=A0A1H5ZKY2_9PSEU|nr:HSP90 family protein [Saccharopolyspora kobensis]SEG36891.1 molecular chaperone HtpG [Saccharopolyspora kobensis]SFF20839.1 molecular chaperone HtpG [Saccharopolyspora kobensis]